MIRVEDFLLIITLLGGLNFLFIVLVLFVIRHSNQALEHSFEALEKDLARIENAIRDEAGRSREESGGNAREAREELSRAFKHLGDSISARMAETGGLLKNQLDTFSSQLNHLTTTNDKRLEQMRATVENQLKALQEDNNRKLEQMRATVDEKLHNTLEQRLGQSFKIVSDRLELVHKGLGEMQSLATGVGDLKKVLTNVKTRGVIGEYQLENILEQMLTPEQYAKNVKTKNGSNAMVEFAVKLPGRKDTQQIVWLPLDAKFPTEDYQNLLSAYEGADTERIESARKQLAGRIKLFAKDIQSKYIDPPNTTDFGIMFLPFEGLYAEVLRLGLFEVVQREHKIVISGPTTLAAFLNSLQMGFRTLAIEKRSSEVWEILGAVKTEFGKFGEILDKTQKKLKEASNVIDQAGVRSRAIERKLRDVQELPLKETELLLNETDTDEA
jgi:DNA recombination protein RmuC